MNSGPIASQRYNAFVRVAARYRTRPAPTVEHTLTAAFGRPGGKVCNHMPLRLPAPSMRERLQAELTSLSRRIANSHPPEFLWGLDVNFSKGLNAKTINQLAQQVGVVGPGESIIGVETRGRQEILVVYNPDPGADPIRMSRGGLGSDETQPTNALISEIQATIDGWGEAIERLEAQARSGTSTSFRPTGPMGTWGAFPE